MRAEAAKEDADSADATASGASPEGVCRPLYGALRHLMELVPGVDLTAPVGNGWEAESWRIDPCSALPSSDESGDA
jgi:hypothetical protein